LKRYLLALLFPVLIGCSEPQQDSTKDTPEVKTSHPSSLNQKSEKKTSAPFKAAEVRQFSTPGHKNQPVKSKQMLNVVQINQNPELKYGCEITSLAMMLSYAGIKTNKMELFHAVKKDADPLVRSRNGDILRWGNPHDGFVGDMTGKRAGYAVFDKPVENMVNQYLLGRAVNLTGRSFDEVLAHVSTGHPVVVWTTGDFRLPDRWESWYHGQQLIRTPLDLHAVVLVGYDSQYVYLNDPLSGKKQVPVNKRQFINSWHALKSRAVSYK